MHRPARATVLVTLLWIPSVLAFAVYSPTTGPVSVLALVMPLALAASGWGMFVRARRQLLLSLRERALRAEADQELHEEQARVAERTRIAREMHDVLAHRISLMALHAGGLEVRPDLPPDQVQETAALLRATARQALEELRGVIGVLRENDGRRAGAGQPAADAARHPPARRGDPERRRGHRLRDARRAHADDVPGPLGRDAYRIVQEALTNVGKHARGAAARVRVTGAPGDGLHISVRNRQPVPAHATPDAARLRRRPARAAGAGRTGRRHPRRSAPTAPATSWWRRS